MLAASDQIPGQWPGDVFIRIPDERTSIHLNTSSTFHSFTHQFYCKIITVFISEVSDLWDSRWVKNAFMCLHLNSVTERSQIPKITTDTAIVRERFFGQ